MVQIKEICLLALLLFFIFPASSQNRVAEISPRIGLEIDPEERLYFNLFPEVDDFKNAIYSYDGFGNLQFLVSCGNGKDTVYTINALGINDFKNFINYHETIFEDQTLINWSMLPGFKPGKMVSYENKGDNYTIVTNNGIITGELLYATDSTVMIWQSDGYYKYTNDSSYAAVCIRSTNIKEMYRKQNIKSSLIGLTAGIGVGVSFFANNSISYQDAALLTVVGAGVGYGLGFLAELLTRNRRHHVIKNNEDYYKTLVPNLLRRSIFRTLIPPELRTFKANFG